MEEFNQIAKDLGGVLKKMERVQKEHFSKFSNDDLKQIMPIQVDYSKIVKAVENGDTVTLQQQLEKYANFNRK